METEVKKLAEYILSRREDLVYWSNEDGWEFYVRNKQVFADYGHGLGWDQWVPAADLVIPQLPKKTRIRNFGSSYQMKK